MPGAEYFRRDHQKITAPNLAAKCTYAEHIVRARGKRTAYTSVSLHPDAIRDFGNTLYQVKRPKLEDDGHALVQHGGLLAELRKAAAKESKGRAPPSRTGITLRQAAERGLDRLEV
jgi:hypothetical protein